jgi:oligopeptide/dipeptide ABC transporter ATP-binding protein
MGQVLSVRGLSKTFEISRSLFSVKKGLLRAVDDVTFSLEKGSTVGIVGESGSGKSTLLRCLMFLDRPDSGEVRFLGKDLAETGRLEMKALRKRMQMIFQDPYSSLNPRKKVGDVIGESLRFRDGEKAGVVSGRVGEVLAMVGLDGDFAAKYPHEMSGGQRQRVAIGRALAMGPDLLMADEPVSSLDVSIQAQIINLFLDIREAMDLSMLFVSHDLNIVRFVADEILVMYRGRVVESGTRNDVFHNPLHPYTRMLIDAARGTRKRAPEANGSVPGDGCPYFDRCERGTDRCLTSPPGLEGGHDHRVACPYA